MKSKKHKKIEQDFEKQKSKHLEKIANKLLENDEKFRRLREKEIDPKFLNLF